MDLRLDAGGQTDAIGNLADPLAGREHDQLLPGQDFGGNDGEFTAGGNMFFAENRDGQIKFLPIQRIVAQAVITDRTVENGQIDLPVENHLL
ncbi:Uncharacterised protein [uncultured Blautia sp.]|nr:Uncharacterised protein [uncultured Blautia sp.]